MNRSTNTRSRLAKLLLFALSCSLSFSTFQAASEDIDIFSVDVDNTVNAPNVLIVLDNSANWSRQAQDWEGDHDNDPSTPDVKMPQGQSEVRAIKEVINELPTDNLNIGLFEYSTGGSSKENDGGYVRAHIRPMTDGTNGTVDNKGAFSAKLDTIFNNIETPVEKRGQGNPFGTLFEDVYRYLAGSLQSGGNKLPRVPGAGTPASRADPSGYNTLYSQFRSPLATTDTCTRTIVIFIANNVQAGPTPDDQVNVDALKALAGGGTAGDEAVAQIPFADFVVTSTNTSEPDDDFFPATYKANTSACYNDVAACTSAENNTACTEAGFTDCFCEGTGTDCQQETFTVFGRATTQTDVSETTSPTEEDQPTGEATKCQNNDPGAYTCPLSSSTFTPGPGDDETTEETISWANCSYVEQTNACGNNDNKSLWTPLGDKTVTTKITRTTVVDTELGPSGSCSVDPSTCDVTTFADCNPADGTPYTSCFCAGPSTSAGCPITGKRFTVKGNFDIIGATVTDPPSFSPPPAGPFMLDEWARFLFNTGVPLPDTSPAVNVQVKTYTIDVFKEQQHPDQSALLFNAARVGGGKYFQARNEQAIKDAIQEILGEVQAVNSAFSSASLPVNATNRAQNENQVFIGLFRPDQSKRPVWYGNLKRYQIIASGAALALGDVNGDVAINNETGFISDCAVSFWTTDSGSFWDTVTYDQPDARSECNTIALTDRWKDLPDGPFVEKGAVAQLLRNRTSARNMLTLSGGSLVPFSTTSTGLDSTTVEFIKGKDALDHDDQDGITTETRSTIHGDVIHSRPQPINYGGTAAEIESGTKPGVVAFYGANDGTYRAVRAHTGEELWSFVAPEHYSKLARLKNNDPTIQFFDAEGDDPPGPQPKDYFFDGSTGVFQKEDNSIVRIFTTMRKGGRKLYAFNVLDPAAPEYLWSKGCPNLDNDTGCTIDANGDFTEIGQTWSVPNVAFIEGHSTTDPVVVIGGGYDPCEDTNNSAPNCAGAKGGGVYVLNSTNGNIVKHFDFNGRSVSADVALIDTTFDGRVDYAYAVDMGGKVYRMDFIDSSGNALPSTGWTFRQIAQTDPAAGRKFLFAPALFQASGGIVYLAVGSGDREHPLITQYPFDDKNDDSVSDGGVVNRFYVFKDRLADTVTSPPTPTVINLDDATGTIMEDYTLENPPGCPSSPPAPLKCPSDRGVLPGEPEKGWYISLTPNGQGEQTVTSAVISAGFVIFSTNRPTAASDVECTNSLGEARGYIMNLFSASGAIGVQGAEGGDRSSVFTGGGLPPSPVVAVVPVDGVLEPVVIGAVQKDGSASSAIGAQRIRPPISPERTPVYWFKTGDTD